MRREMGWQREGGLPRFAPVMRMVVWDGILEVLGLLGVGCVRGKSWIDEKSF